MYTMSRATNVYRSNFKLDIEPKPKLYARWDYDLMRQLAFLEVSRRNQVIIGWDQVFPNGTM